MKLEKKLSNLKAVFTAKEDCPINETETHVFYSGVWREISEDQDGEKYIMYGMQTCYFTTEREETDSLELFTPGQWVGERHNNPDYIDIEGDSRICSILINAKELEEIGSSVEEAEANAALIAASKDMYRAIEKILRGISVAHGTGVRIEDLTLAVDGLKEAKEAINKATPKK